QGSLRLLQPAANDRGVLQGRQARLRNGQPAQPSLPGDRRLPWLRLPDSQPPGLDRGGALCRHQACCRSHARVGGEGHQGARLPRAARERASARTTGCWRTRQGVARGPLADCHAAPAAYSCLYETSVASLAELAAEGVSEEALTRAS